MWGGRGQDWDVMGQVGRGFDTQSSVRKLLPYLRGRRSGFSNMQLHLEEQSI